MSAPDYSRGFVRVPLAVWLATFCRGALTRRQLQLVAVVIRESWGWQGRDGRPFAWTRPMDATAFSRATGIAAEHVRRELRALLARGVLAQDAGRWSFEPERLRGEADPDAGQAALARPEPGAKTAQESQRNVARVAFVALLADFAGPLAADQAEALRRWVDADGAAAVWSRLEAAFAAGQAAAREALLAALAERMNGGDA